MKIYGDLSKLSSKVKVIILIGESGVGKSTLAKFLDMPDSWFISSDLIIDIVVKKGFPVNHNTIHEIAKEKYGEDPYWQIPYMLRVLNETDLLLLDGPRITDEVNRIVDLCPETVFIKVVAGLQERQKRLNERDGVDEKTFKKIVTDEKSETGLVDHLLTMADITIENNGTIEDLQDAAREISTRIGR